jgi:CBS domain-containing protein
MTWNKTKHMHQTFLVFVLGRSGAVRLDRCVQLLLIASVVTLALDYGGYAKNYAWYVLNYNATTLGSAFSDSHSSFDIGRSQSSPIASVVSLGATALVVTLLGLCFYKATKIKWRSAESRRNKDQAPHDQCVSHDKRYVTKRQAILRSMPSGSLDGITVRQVMTSHGLTVRPSLATKDAAEMMNHQQVHHLLVCDAEGHLVGVASDRDLKINGTNPISSVMTHNPITVSRDTTLMTAASVMLDRRISCLPVVDGAVLSGILTFTDVVLTLQVVLRMLSDNHLKQHSVVSSAR